jgi:hypothetical protein
MLYLMMFCVSLVAIVVWYVSASVRLNTQYGRYIEGVLRQVPGFRPAEVFVPTRDQLGIGIDPVRRSLCIAGPTHTGHMPPLVLIPFADIVEAEVVVDQHTFQRSTRAQSIVGAAAGTVLAGPLGMVAGATVGAAGARRITSQVGSIAVKLLVRNAPEPSYTFLFYRGPAISTDGAVYGCAMPQAERLHDLLRVAMSDGLR